MTDLVNLFGPDVRRLIDQGSNRGLLLVLLALSRGPASGADLNALALKLTPRIGMGSLTTALSTCLENGLIRSDGTMFHLEDEGRKQLNDLSGGEEEPSESRRVQTAAGPAMPD